MSEIEKMYENAGIKPTHYDACALEDKYWNNEELTNQYGTLDGYLSFECPHYGEGCYSTCEYAYDKDEYSSFTAGKQLELFKLLIRHYKTELYCGDTNDKYKLIMYTEDCCTSDIGSFENVLASVVCDVWGLLSEKEKQQVKGILE